MEKIFSHAWRDKRGLPTEDDDKGKTKAKDNTSSETKDSQGAQADTDYVDDEQGLQRRHLVDTTLTIHFFGKKGKDELKFEGFRRCVLLNFNLTSFYAKFTL